MTDPVGIVPSTTTGVVIPFPKENRRPPKPARTEVYDDSSGERLGFVVDFLIASASTRLGIPQLAARYDMAWGFAFGLWPPAASE